MLSGTATAQVRTTVLGRDDSLAAYIPYFFREAPPAIQLPKVDVEAARREDKRRKGRPPRFGLFIPVEFGVNNGTFYDLGNDTIVWKGGIHSPGATSLSFTFDDLRLPSGAQMYLTNDDESMVMGPIDDKTLYRNRLNTDLLAGERVCVWVFLPGSRREYFSLRITRAIHGYTYSSATRDYDDSDLCLIDVNCPLGNGWEDERDAVGMIIDGNRRLCSGVLVNNACQDYRPFFLTAFHCLDDNSNTILTTAEQEQVENWLFRFNYESPAGSTSPPNCRGPEPTSWLTFDGAQLHAFWQDTDMALLELNSSVLGESSLALAGWERRDLVPTEVTSIHHPQGDVKKISRDNDPPTVIEYNGPNTNPIIGGTTHWQVSWDDGVTQNGSSGGPAFDQNHRVIGTLHDGRSFCGVESGEPDWYGRFFSSWDGGGTPATGLRDWLGGPTTPPHC